MRITPAGNLKLLSALCDIQIKASRDIRRLPTSIDPTIPISSRLSSSSTTRSFPCSALTHPLPPNQARSSPFLSSVPSPSRFPLRLWQIEVRGRETTGVDRGRTPGRLLREEQNRHRLSRARTWRMNHVVHVAAIVQIRHDTAGRAYCRRLLVVDSNATVAGLDAGPGGHCGGDTSIQPGRLAPAHRRFGSATSQTREPDATPNTASPEEVTRSCRLTTEGSRKDSLGRTSGSLRDRLGGEHLTDSRGRTLQVEHREDERNVGHPRAGRHADGSHPPH